MKTTKKIFLNIEVITTTCDDAVSHLKTIFSGDLVKIIFYGSCARGDYAADSDIDIAILTDCDRVEAKKYLPELSRAQFYSGIVGTEHN